LVKLLDDLLERPQVASLFEAESMTNEKIRQEVAGRLAESKRIEAIKLYRELFYRDTGRQVSLKAAKLYTDNLLATLGRRRGVGSVPTLTNPERDEILRLWREGHRIQAYKYTRTITGCGLKEAKLAVDTLVALGAPA
jgi:ribosomal protein L7/L12